MREKKGKGSGQVFIHKLFEAPMRSMVGALAFGLAVVFCAWLGEAGAADETVTERSNLAIKRCVEAEFQAERDGTACIGRFADPCTAREDMQSTEEQVECIEREFVLWNQLLRSEYQDMQSLLADDETRGRLQRTQRLWREFHKANCRLPYRLHTEETIARPIGAYCSLRLTAHRVLELRGWRQGLSKN